MSQRPCRSTAFVLLLSVLLTAAACSSESSPADAPDAATPALDAGGPDAAAVPDAGGADLAEDAALSCDPQRAAGEGDGISCGADYALRYVWDGARCAALPGCACTGDDCEALHPSADACLAARSHCAPEPWPAQGLHPLRGTDPELADDDLAPLAGIIGSASVVALGESVHTSGGYYWTKVRVFQHLVRQHGFRAFAIESPRTDAEQVAAYVETCSGDPRVAVGYLFGVWAADATVALLQWICAWNQAHPGDEIGLFGFDAQQPWDDSASLAAFFAQTAADESALLADLEQRCNGAGYATAAAYYQAKAHEKPIDAATHAACVAAVAAARSYLEDNAAALAAETSADALDLARLALLGVESWEDEMFYSEYNPPHTDVPRSFEARDRAMATNFRELRRIEIGAQTKTMIWAHNTHIARAQHLVDGYYGKAKSMGTFLSEELAKDYVAIGLVGRVVEINWPGVGTGPQPPSSPGSVEDLLSQQSYPYLLVDLAPPAPAAPFFTAQQIYELGYEGMVPAEQFRALLYLGHSPGMKAVLW